ncbi:MAG: 2-oxo acid dehydrogenase subunit E2 [bacterium]|nr:2-oxo acid dehydrogenase subunit E2 [bacterium]
MNQSHQSIALKVPDLGGFDQVEVIEVLVSEGDRVELEAPLITLESDKAAMDIPAERAGVIESLSVKTGDQVSPGDVFAQLRPDEAGDKEESEDSEAAEETSKAQPQEPPIEDTPPQEPVTTEPGVPAPDPPKKPDPGDATDADALPQISFKGVHASPTVRRFARQLGADLNQVEGRGRKGRITEEDVRQFVKSQLQGSPQSNAPEAVDPKEFERFGPVEVRDLSRIRKKSAQSLQRNWSQVPLVTQFDEADITETEAFRQAQKQAAEKEDVKLTLLPLIAKACVKALQEFPEVNASVDMAGGRAIIKGYFHLGFAVDTDQGLVVVVVPDADQKGVYKIARELDQKAQRARQGKLGPQDIQGASFSISNLGAAGGTGFTPLLNGSNVGVLGIARAKTQPVWTGAEFQPRLILPISFSYDHRLIDGVQGARFLRRLCELIEDLRPLLL